MVFNGQTVMSVAHLSAEIWQRLRRIPPSDRISSSEMLELVCFFPLQQLGRFALCLLSFLCLPPPGLLYPEADEDDHDDHSFVYGSSSSSIATHQHHFHLHFE
ncbi:hypothetical protein CARUB_v10006222mg [Capsella rubella]|uniref:Uncharacterized protein n=1 Tax=Capsella rubella TaxID=81985 RepID=R0F874_9BRAS|nr:uncharacterized protein LOC17877779 [Capsella rubella]EOA17821.1 hypothetical protein CARUB_v10006222mg [Capsella rubella]